MCRDSAWHVSPCSPCFTLGPSLQLGRWDSQGPPTWAEAVLLWQEQPGSKLQKPGPLRHHKVCLTCEFAKALSDLFFFFLFSGLSVWYPHFFLIVFYFTQTQTSLFSFSLSSWSLPHSGSLSLSFSICSSSLSLLSLILFTRSRSSASTRAVHPHYPASTSSYIPLSRAFDNTSFSCVTSSSEKGAGFCSLSFLSLCLLSWKQALVTSKLCVSVSECVAMFTCPWPYSLKVCCRLISQAAGLLRPPPVLDQSVNCSRSCSFTPNRTRLCYVMLC